MLKPLQRMIAWAFALALLLSGPAHAWNGTGHDAVAEIAYRQLDASARGRVLAILRQHPFYRQWMRQRPGGMNEAEYLILRAATWPDEIRDVPAYHRGPWHYVNVPYVPHHDVPTPPIGGALMQALPANVATLQNPNANGPQKAIALCWIIHLTGDLHQPLHTVAYFSRPLYTDGDHGGNDFFVQASNQTEKLHGLWDGLLGSGDPVASASGIATQVVSRFPRAALPEVSPGRVIDFNAWMQESVNSAARDAYLQGQLQGVDEAHRRDARPVPPGYVENARSVAARRVAAAGYRLGDVLAALTP